MGSALTTATAASEDGHRARIDEARILIQRMRELQNAPLDADDLEAIAEATDTDIRLLEQLQDVELGQGGRRLGHRVLEQYRGLNSELRKTAAAGILAVPAALLSRMGEWMDAFTKVATGGEYAICGQIAYLIAIVALINAARSRMIRGAVIAGAVFGAAFSILRSIFALVFLLPVQSSAYMLPLFTLGGAVLGGVAWTIAERGFGRFKPKDADARRRALLAEMQDLRKELQDSSHFSTIVSIDVVNSTKLKAATDPLDAEYTFTEYHAYVETVGSKYGGHIHSRAGDGVTIDFADPAAAFYAAKNLQLALPEFARAHSRLKDPLLLRIGIHSGQSDRRVYDDVTQIVFSDVIDFAAHLQKACPAGSIVVSEETAAKIPGGPDAISETRIVVDDRGAVVWSSKRLTTAGTAAITTGSTARSGDAI